MVQYCNICVGMPPHAFNSSSNCEIQHSQVPTAINETLSETMCVSVCVCARARPKIFKACSNCEVQHSYVLPSFISETMSSEFERLAGRLLGTSTLIHSFPTAPYVHCGSYCPCIVLLIGAPVRTCAVYLQEPWALVPESEFLAAAV